ncbi:MAG: FAD-dependent monooxygenase [Saprospirales bacterium]|nr:FAD-dependent monooxygenase [Saprospirales bacterium]
MKEKRGIIVGAGLVGSLWAIFLAKRGYEVDVFERRGDMRQKGYSGGRSINLAMSRRGWKAIERAGIKDLIEPHAIPMKGRMIHSVEGELAFQPYGKEGQAIYSVSRGGLNLELLKAAGDFPNVRLHFDQICRDLELDTNTLVFEHAQTGEPKTVQAPLLFGTDGAFSAVRGSMMKTPRFDYSQEYLSHSYKELTIPAGPGGSFLLEKNALHIWPRHQFMLIALPNADGSFTCTLFLAHEGPSSFEQLKTDADVEAFFQRYFPDAMAMMPTLLEDFRNNPTGMLLTVRCSPWEYERRVLLLGDAAHAIVPFYGQGMNAGFEDCTILDELAGELNEDWEKIFDRFNRERIKDGNAIAELALRNFIEMRDLVADPQFLLRKKIAAHLHGKYGDAFLPSYSMVSFSDTPYHIALRASDEQDRLLDRILKIQGIEQSWDRPEVDALFEDWKKA